MNDVIVSSFVSCTFKPYHEINLTFIERMSANFCSCCTVL